MDELEPTVRKTRRRSMRNLRRQSLIFAEASNDEYSSYLLGMNKEYAEDKEKNGGMLEQYGSLWVESNNVAPAKKLRRRRSSIVPIHSVDLLRKDFQEFEIENLRTVEKEDMCITPPIKSTFLSPLSVLESLPEPGICDQTIVHNAHPETPPSLFTAGKGLAVSNIYKVADSGFCNISDRLDQEDNNTAILDLKMAYSNLYISASMPGKRPNGRSMSPDFPHSPSTSSCFQQESQNKHQGSSKAGDGSPYSVSQLSSNQTQMLESSCQYKDKEDAIYDQSHNGSKNDSLGSSFLSLCRTLAGKVASLVRISPQGNKTSDYDFPGNEMCNSPVLYDKHNTLMEGEENIKNLSVTDMIERDKFPKNFLMKNQLTYAVIEKTPTEIQKLSFHSVEKQQNMVEDSSSSSLTKKLPVKRKKSLSKAFQDTFKAVSEELNKDNKILIKIELDENQRMRLDDYKSNEIDCRVADEIQGNKISDGGDKFGRLNLDSCESYTLDHSLADLIKEPSADDNALSCSSEVTFQEVEDTWNALGSDSGIIDDTIVKRIINICEAPKMQSLASKTFSKQSNEMIFIETEEKREDETFRRESLELATGQVSFTQLRKSLENTDTCRNKEECIQYQADTNLLVASPCKEQYIVQENVNENITEGSESCIQEYNNSKDMFNSAQIAEQRAVEAERPLNCLTMQDVLNQSTTRRKKRRSELIVLQEKYSDTFPSDVEMNYLEHSDKICGNERRRRRSADVAIMRLHHGSRMAQLDEEEILCMKVTDHESDFLVNEGMENSKSEKISNRRACRNKTQQFSTALQDISNANISRVAGRTAKKRGKDIQETNLEEFYRNKNYKKPEVRMWETIFEQSDSINYTSEEKIFSKKRYQRVSTFEKPTQLKLRRRLQKAIKNGWDPKTRRQMALPDAIVEAKIANLEIELNSLLDT